MSLFNKKSAKEPATQPDNSGKNKLSLLVLVLLLAVFGYLYFFTSLIVPHEAPPAVAPAPSPQVKQAMPPRGTETAAPVAGEVKGPQEVKPQTPAVQAPAAPPGPAAQKPAVPAPVPAAQKPAVSAPVPAAQKPAPPVPAKVEAKPAPPVKKEAQKPLPAAVAKEQKPAATALAKKTAKTGKARAAEAAKKKEGVFTLNLGEFAAGSQVAGVEEKLDKLKIKPVLKQQAEKNAQMNRLFYKSYTDYDAMTAELEKLKTVSKSFFAIEKDGKYSIYAGSFSSAALAEQEKKRLSARGVSVVLQKVKLPLSMVKITAGRFSTRAEADKAAASLRQQGLNAKVTSKKK